MSESANLKTDHSDSFKLPAKSLADKGANRQWLAALNRLFGTHNAVVLLFILFALPTCLVLAMLVPLGEVPDEPAHVVRAASLLRGEILGQRRTLTNAAGKPVRVAGIITNPALLPAGYAFPGLLIAQKKLTRATVERMRSVAWAKTEIYIASTNTAIYMPLFYLPVAAAIGIAKLLSWSPYHAIFMARIANVLCYVFFGALALGLAKRGRAILFAALSLPMTLLLAASCNQDGLLIASASIAAALLTRVIKPRGWPYWIAGALLASVIAVKIPYLPLAALMLLPYLADGTAQNRENFSAALRTCFLVALPGLLWTTISVVFVSAPFSWPPYHPGPLWPGNPALLFDSTDTAAQTQVLLHNPRLVLVLPLNAMSLERNIAHWHEMIGVLGMLDVYLPPWLYTSWSIALFLGALGDLLVAPDAAGNSFRLPGFLLGVSAVACSLFALYDLEYLTWTEVGMFNIEGIQGRYFLPMFVFFAAFLPALPFKQYRITQKLLSLPTVIMAAAGLLLLPAIIVETYYLP